MRYVAVALAGLVVASGGLADEERNRAAAAPPGEAPPSAEKLAGFFGRTKGITRLVPPSDVWEGITSGRSRYFVVDVRPADDYAKGHVPGALSLPIDVLFRPESLAKLPDPQRGKPILLVCKSGHTESMALGGLVALGYEPWVMRFGMIGWNAETKVNAGAPTQEPDTVRGVGGPIER
jgi:rhodanese-related sulfurtransferase